MGSVHVMVGSRANGELRLDVICADRQGDKVRSLSCYWVTFRWSLAAMLRLLPVSGKVKSIFSVARNFTATFMR